MGDTNEKRRSAYQGLFDEKISEEKLKEIRDTTNKAWVLGNNRFKKQIEEQTSRRVSPLGRGGDRKSKKYRSNSENQLL